MRVLFVASEAFPLIKTGGLADVCGALPLALAPLGIEVKLLLPAYPALLSLLKDVELALPLPPDAVGGPARLLSASYQGLSLLLYDNQRLFGRAGNPYLDAEGRDWPDNGERFAALCWAGALVGAGAWPAWQPQLLHCHDWQAGLTPLYSHQLAGANAAGPAHIFTIHNLAYQGLFPLSLASEIKIAASSLGQDGAEFHGKIGFLKAGLWYSDQLTTVSPTYAEEIQHPEHGAGLDGLLRMRQQDLHGILNGIDTQHWDPAQDPYVPMPYGPHLLENKVVNKIAAQVAFGLEPKRHTPLFCVISRLTEQKGLDLVLASLPGLLSQGGQFALIGSGDKSLEQGFIAMAKTYPGRVGVRLGYEEGLSHLLQAGADAIIVPSRFEPCGLTQLYGLRYGTLPIVRRTGGLADTVIGVQPWPEGHSTAPPSAEGATGFVFDHANSAALGHILSFACQLYEGAPARWRALQQNAMHIDHSWQKAAKLYAALYTRCYQQNLARR
jgi:starch synthase